MKVSIVLERVSGLVAALNYELENDAVESDIEKVSRELEVAIASLEKFVPNSFAEAHAISAFFLGLIDKIHDDVDLAKKYARLASRYLNQMNALFLDTVPDNKKCNHMI